MHKISWYYRATKGNKVRTVCIMIGIYCAQRHYEVKKNCTWWRHQMETFSALLDIYAANSPVPGEFPTQRPVTRSFDVFFDLRLNKRLSKQSWGWWFETPIIAPIMTSPLWNYLTPFYSYTVCKWCNVPGKLKLRSQKTVKISYLYVTKKSSNEKEINTNWSELSDRSNLILQQ